ncbi:hypothetical protein GDO78_010220 [Eleutherodactylus coqui]|uniref:Uncharacterized protein n=1 Tax=Eleutherodactylus coqui TaxID=57060 RepID=A0A8J6F3H3_ELECQ|nr:hypothetical protein GDO78_010220 [Eleutherodactylus coqui]
MQGLRFTYQNTSANRRWRSWDTVYCTHGSRSIGQSLPGRYAAARVIAPLTHLQIGGFTAGFPCKGSNLQQQLRGRYDQNLIQVLRKRTSGAKYSD